MTVTHQALYRRWRAQTFREIVGQEAVVATLRNAVRSERVAHALLFVGPRGTGKTSVARILAKALNCTDLRDGEPCDRCPSCVAVREGRALDVIEMDAASNNRVDDMRDLLPRIYTTPSDLRRKVFIVDEVQRISQGWDVLLKTLEEPPDHVAFIFCTTDPSQIRPAVLSRVQRFDFRRLTVPQIEGKLRTILAADGTEADDAAVALIAHLAEGGMRDAESMLDQLLASGADRLDADGVRALVGLADAEEVTAFVDALVERDAAAGLRTLAGLEDRGRDVRAFLDQVVDAIREAMLGELAGAGSGRVAALADAAARLAAIDPTRSGPGGLRLQLELALLAPARSAATSSSTPGIAIPVRATELAPVPAVRSTEDAGDPPGAAAPETTGPHARAPRAKGAATRAPGSSAPDGTQRGGARPIAPDATSTAAPPTSADAAGPAVGPAEVTDAGTARPGAAPGTVALDAVASPADAAAATVAADAGTVPPDAAAGTAADAGETAVTGPPAAIPADAPAGPPSNELAALRDQWPEVVAFISRHPPTKPLISACRPIAVEGNVVTLGFPEGQAFLKDVADRRRANLEEGIGHFLGHAVAVRCVATNIDLAAELPSDPDAVRLVEEARRIFADDLVDVGEVG